MSLIPTYLRRPTAILKMPEAIARGMTVTGFINSLKASGLSYRRAEMLADWRGVAGIQAKKDRMKYVRKDRLPSTRAVADVPWTLSKEFMYKVNTFSRLHPDEPLQERFVNVMSDVPMTPQQIEQQVMSMWGQWEKYAQESIEGLKVVGAYRRIESPLEEG